MAMIKCVVFLPEMVLDEYAAMSKRSGRSRSALMRVALEEGVDVIQSKLRGEEGTPQRGATSGSSSGQRMSWSPPTPADWKFVNTIGDIVQALVEAHAEWEREAIRNALSWKVSDAGFEGVAEVDMSRWCEMALTEILGPEGAERPRAVPGNRPPK